MKTYKKTNLSVIITPYIFKKKYSGDKKIDDLTILFKNTVFIKKN